MRIRILSYNKGSAGAKELQKQLQVLGHNVLRVQKYNLRRVRQYLNWGCSTLQIPETLDVVNAPIAVSSASNKKTTLDILCVNSVPCVEHISNPLVALAWQQKGHDVVVRHILNGHGGNGIEILKPEQELPDAPLYTKYFKHKAEYRVHVFAGEVILVQQKLKKREVEHVPGIRNHDNGYVFSTNYTLPPDPAVLAASVQAVQALGLTFGAVDIGWNQKKKQAAVFEVNTAPGLTESTAKLYAEALVKYWEEA